MPSSAVDICNSALIRLGAARIDSLSGNSQEAVLCNEQYEKVRDMVLRSHPWRFALKRAQLAALPTTPAFEYSKQYQVPTDCLRIIEMDGQEQYNWVVEGDALLTDIDTCLVRYIKKETDVTKYDSFFSETLAVALAYNLTFSLVQSIDMRNDMLKEYNRLLGEARSYSAQEKFGDRVYADTWLNARS